MEYKKFGAEIKFNSTEERFDGVVVGASQDVSFTGTSFPELKRNFQAAVDKHITRCVAKHTDAYRKFSGTLILRIAEDLHRDLFLKAQRDGKSLNKWIEGALRERLREDH